MRIAVTGASGFIGSHLMRALASRGAADLIAIDRAEPPEALPGRFVRLELQDATPQDFARIGQPDVLVHLAWGGLPNYLSLHHFEEELPVQYRFLKAMVEGGLKAMLVTGTCYEYGMVNGELAEDRAPAPANPYAFAKAALLGQLEYLREIQPFSLTWARLFYLWGEGQAKTSIYPLLKAAITRGDTTFPMSQGEQLRDYLPVDDVAGILADLALRAANAGIVNVCSGEPISIRRLVERWINELGAAIAPELGHFPYPTYEPLAFWGSSAKRRSLLEK
jgi:dTDP-6-deoxy-L-talose 4-dehydrogenase (NAD+)